MTSPEEHAERTLKEAMEIGKKLSKLKIDLDYETNNPLAVYLAFRAEVIIARREIIAIRRVNEKMLLALEATFDRIANESAKEAFP